LPKDRRVDLTLSVVYGLIVVVKERKQQMIAKLTDGTLVPLHWDDREYVATCPKCGEDVYARNILQVEEILDYHC